MGKRISKNEVYENRFYRIPKAFFKTEKYKKMSLYAKVIYGFLDDRRELSLKNNWVDEEDNIYLIFTRKEIEDMLCLSDKPVTKAFKELKDYGLIEEVVQGLNKPNLIYVCHIDFENIEDMRIRNISDSGAVKNTNQESDNVRSIDTNINNTNKSETEKVLHHLSEINNVYIISYLLIMKMHGYSHKRVNEDNFDYILNAMDKLTEYGITTDIWKQEVYAYFENEVIGSNNDGDIIRFLKAGMRYFEIDFDR